MVRILVRQHHPNNRDKHSMKTVYSQPNSQEFWQEQLDKVVAQCEARDIEVNVGSRKENMLLIYEDRYVIWLNSRVKPETRLYLLLHELGHVFILRDKKLITKFSRVNSKAKSLSLKILEIEEEVLAWHMGEQFARKDDIYLGPGFLLCKAKCLKTYISSV